MALNVSPAETENGSEGNVATRTDQNHEEEKRHVPLWDVFGATKDNYEEALATLMRKRKVRPEDDKTLKSIIEDPSNPIRSKMKDYFRMNIDK